ncbi:MAG: hypothetical protein KGJ59_03590, partial [Bacteroidota bacterium]|nr:hypothetical protein [Bacteroidota bacterium]
MKKSSTCITIFGATCVPTLQNFRIIRIVAEISGLDRFLPKCPFAESAALKKVCTFAHFYKKFVSFLYTYNKKLLIKINSGKVSFSLAAYY